MNQNKFIHVAAVALLAWTGAAQAQTVNLINNLGAGDTSAVLRSGGSLLSANTRYLLGTFGSMSHASIQGLFGGDANANLSAINANFSILADLSDSDGGAFARIITNEASEEFDLAGFSFVGNEAAIAATFHNKPIQVVVLSPLADLGNPASEIGVFSAWDYTGGGAGSAVTWLAADLSDVNNFAFQTSGALASYEIQIGALAIVGTSSGDSFYLSSATAIPEPASGSLVLLGAAGVLALRRLRKSNV